MWWVAASDNVSNLYTIAGATIAAIGAVVAAVILSRRQTSGPRKIKPSMNRRMDKIEAWRDHYADPLLGEVKRRFQWDPPDEEDWPNGE